MSKRRRTWLRGEGFRVYVVPALQLDGDECYACYDPTNGNITVVDDVPEVMRRKLFHELVHAACHGMSGRDRVDIFGTENHDDREEALACFMESKMFDILSRNGWLRFPKAPR